MIPSTICCWWWFLQRGGVHSPYLILGAAQLGFFGGAFCKSHKSLEKLSDKPSCLMLFYQLYSYFQLSFIGLFFAWLLLCLKAISENGLLLTLNSSLFFWLYMRDLTIGLVLELHWREKLHQNLFLLLIERRKEKCNNKKRLTIFAISKTNSIMSATMIVLLQSI